MVAPPHNVPRSKNGSGLRPYVCVSYLQVVDEQLIEGGVGVKVDQEALVIHHSDPGGLQGDAQALQLLLTLLWETLRI